MLHINKENSEKKQTQKQFFTVTVRDKSRDKFTETQNSKQKFNLILDIFFELMLPKLQKTALQRYSDFKQS